MASGKRENESEGNAMAQNDQLDAALLQNHNQMLFQQLEAQKKETHVLQEKFKELRNVKDSYDATLISVNRRWNQLVDDLVLLGVRIDGDMQTLSALDHDDLLTDAFASLPLEEIFLFRLLGSVPVECNGDHALTNYAREGLKVRHSTTVELMKAMQDAISAQKSRNDCLRSTLDGESSSENTIVQLQNYCRCLKEVINNMHQSVDAILQKHDMYTKEIHAYMESHAREDSEIHRLTEELEENLAELEESRRKLIVLRLQKLGISAINAAVINSENGVSSHQKTTDKAMHWPDLKDSVEEAKTLAANRLYELHEAQEDNLILSKQLEDLEDQLKGDQYIVSSKPYSILEDKLQHLNMELGKYKGLLDNLQNERIQMVQREKEICSKSESVNNIKQSVIVYEAKLEELELQIQKLTSERNEVEIQLEETMQDTEKSDFNDEIQVMASALSKGAEMMENQLNRSKEAASEALALQEKANSLRNLVTNKIIERKTLLEQCVDQEMKIKSLKMQIENLEEEKLELDTILDMYAQHCDDSRTILEIKESEERASKQAEHLRRSRDEHSFQLRIKQANEAETACQLRLFTAEAEIAELRAKLDEAEKQFWELTESIRIKDSEAEVYISEIETIGQAYEDMQAQNQRLLQQISDRDAYNIKLVSDSIKMKQSCTNLLSEKNSILRQLQQVNNSLELSTKRIARGEEQVKAYTSQAIKASSENKHLVISLDKAKLELADAEKEVKWLRSAVGSSEKEYEQNQKMIADLRIELERERNERKKLDEEFQEVRSEVMEMSAENEEVTIRKLQDEIKECKAILKCGVCSDRPKEVVITKCFHLFCSACIQRNLEIRHRRCPGCGTPFGQSDVREVKI